VTGLFIGWLLLPLVLTALALGQGLLIDRLSGGAIHAVLLVPTGLAGVIVASQITTYQSWTTELTTPLVVVLAVAGLALGLPRLRRARLDWWPIGAAVGVLLVFAAPVVFSGHATFAGYTVLGDTSIHFIGADYLLHHGRDFSGLAPSSYEYSLRAYYGAAGYPSGGPTAVGAVRPLVDQDVAWIFQPFLSFFAATMALSLYSIPARLVRSRAGRAAIAFVAAQPALVLAYALQGSIKEIGMTWAVPLLAASIPGVGVDAGRFGRNLCPFLVASAAAVAMVGPAAGVWIVPLALVVLAVSVRGQRLPSPRRLVAAVVVAAAVFALLSAQSLAYISSYLKVAQGTVTTQGQYGNLLGPLDRFQMLGIWLVGDYRHRPNGSDLDRTYALLGIALFAAALGLVWAARRRAWIPLAFVAISLLAWLYVTARGSPWADGKALTIVSPAVVFAVMLGPAALFDVGRRLEALLLAALVALGVLWSNALAYHDVSLAPRDRLGELEHIGHRIAGEGPTVYTEFEEFGKHFLRSADPEGVSEGWQRRLRPLRDGQYPHMGFSYDIDQFTWDYVRYYRTLVLRRSPSRSRPPSIYSLRFRGRFYEVWQRPAHPRTTVVEHFSLGTGVQAADVPDCRVVKSLADRAGPIGGRLAYVVRPISLGIFPTMTAIPAGWFIDPTDALTLRPAGPGKIQGSVVVRRPGSYDLWVEGSFARGFSLLVDGRIVGHVANELNGRGEYAHVATVALQRGRRVITLLRGGGSLRPGNGAPELLGPIVIEPLTRNPDRVRYVSPRAYRALCGKPLDWIEIVRA
jgi:hypothetical protein